MYKKLDEKFSSLSLIWDIQQYESRVFGKIRTPKPNMSFEALTHTNTSSNN